MILHNAINLASLRVRHTVERCIQVPRRAARTAARHQRCRSAAGPHHTVCRVFQPVFVERWFHRRRWPPSTTRDQVAAKDVRPATPLSCAKRAMSSLKLSAQELSNAPQARNHGNFPPNARALKSTLVKLDDVAKRSLRGPGCPFNA